MQAMKQGGLSLKAIALELGCAKITVSRYCRDLFSHAHRKYPTAAEWVEAERQRKKLHVRPCPVCGKNMIRKCRSRCRECYHEMQRLEAREPGPRKAPKAPKVYTWRLKSQRPTAALSTAHICAPSPTGAHYWVLDSKNDGTCRHCSAARNFGTPRPLGDSE